MLSVIIWKFQVIIKKLDIGQKYKFFPKSRRGLQVALTKTDSLLERVTKSSMKEVNVKFIKLL